MITFLAFLSVKLTSQRLFLATCVCVLCLVMWDSVTPWTVACQAPLSMGFSRQEYWSKLPCLPPSRDLPNPGIKSASLKSSASAGGFFTTNATWEAFLNS